ncbi:Hypothetical protein PBC10988_19880 [Planctomycetales bacterium 10988]|nr:Hypothetical protein PBC10988_19880 [Planctomycetales bacterium 10988]
MKLPWGESYEPALEQVLGYLNFSNGKPDPHFQRHFDTLLSAFPVEDEEGFSPEVYLQPLLTHLESLHEAGKAAFQDTTQARQALKLLLQEFPKRYREHHRDLLFHQTNRLLYTSFFLVRVAEALLAQGGPWEEEDRILRGTMQVLNDFVGHRPLAVLHNDRQADLYGHERVRPIPLYLKDVGLCENPYLVILEPAMKLLQEIDPSILNDADFHFDWMEELALDPRAYDFGHPVNRRPNYQFGEWDPHHINKKGHFTRFVLRQVTLDALLDRVENCEEEDLATEELILEAGTVLAGVILMASGISGNRPEHYDSSVTLATLLPVIAGYRDRFYLNRLQKLEGRHYDRLAEEATRTRQPYGGARQHLNRYLAKRRAKQMQHVELARLFAEMGYPAASRRQARIIPVARARFLSEIYSMMTLVHHDLDQGNLESAANALPEIENLLHRAIECGAFVDPWNILGFQGQFSVFAAMENSVHDSRVDELIDLMERLFALQVRCVSETAAAGNEKLRENILAQVQKLAHWWDRFATTEVSSVHHVSGQESWQSASHLAITLKRWHEAGIAAGDLTFWREQIEQFHAPKSYALVIEALINQGDTVAAMALLIQWLSQSEEVALAEGEFSFYALALHWMQNEPFPSSREETDLATPGWSEPASSQTGRQPHNWKTVRKFFDFLEANAEDHWHVPGLEPGTQASHLPDENEQKAPGSAPSAEDPDSDNPYQAAYEGMVYEDSTQDGFEGEMLESGPPPVGEDDWIGLSDWLLKRLRFLAMLADLWRVAVGKHLHPPIVQLALQRQRDEAAAAEHADEVADETASETAETESSEEPEADHPEEESPLEQVQLPEDPEVLKRWQTEFEDQVETLCRWFSQAYQNQKDLQRLLMAILRKPIPTPSDSTDSRVEYERCRRIQMMLAHQVLTARVATHRAALAILAALPEEAIQPLLREYPLPDWQAEVVRLQRIMWQGDREEARNLFGRLVEQLRELSLLYVPLDKRGAPEQVAEAQILHQILRDLLRALPRIGLLRSTYHLLLTIRDMEKKNLAGPRAVTEFDRLFQIGFRAVVKQLIASATAWHKEIPPTLAERQDRPAQSHEQLVDCLQTVTESMLREWLQHSRSLRLSTLERITEESQWESLVTFIRRYGDSLFTPRFLNRGNLLGILHQGVDNFLTTVEQSSELVEEWTLLQDLTEGRTDRAEAVKHLELIFEAIIDDYEEYKDYNAITTQSDRGSNLYMLLDFLRLKASYERVDWNLRPLAIVHEILVRSGEVEAADAWQQVVTERAVHHGRWHLERLKELERKYGMQLPTVGDHIREQFVKPFQLSRIRALVKPAVEEARDDKPRNSFGKLEAEINEFARTPTGAGLDLPAWLLALEEEVRKTHPTTDLASRLLEWMIEVPRRFLTLEEMQAELAHWNRRSMF